MNIEKKIIIADKIFTWTKFLHFTSNVSTHSYNRSVSKVSLMSIFFNKKLLFAEYFRDSFFRKSDRQDNIEEPKDNTKCKNKPYDLM